MEGEGLASKGKDKRPEERDRVGLLAVHGEDNDQCYAPLEAPRQRPDVDLIDSLELALGNRTQHGHLDSSDPRGDLGPKATNPRAKECKKNLVLFRAEVDGNGSERIGVKDQVLSPCTIGGYLEE